MMARCPGQDPRNLKAEIIPCPGCAYEVEIFSDEMNARCPRCKKDVIRQGMPSCVEWCNSARECVGSLAYDAFVAHKAITLKEKLLQELESYFGDDARRILHAKKVMGYAEELLKKEGGDWGIVIPASILHDVGIKNAESKFGSSAGHYQEREGPAIAQGILLRLGFKNVSIGEICAIIGKHHSPGALDSMNFAIVCDADWLVNLPDEVDMRDKGRIAGIINKVFVTESAKQIARRTYLQ